MNAVRAWSAAPAAVAPPTWTAAWTDALTELELDVAEAEEVLRVGHAMGPAGPAWVPPSNLGRLPAPLVERAQALLTRQLQVAVSLAEAAEQSRRQLRVVSQLRAAPEASPVYLDTAG